MKFSSCGCHELVPTICLVNGGKTPTNRLRRCLRDRGWSFLALPIEESGATAVEYGIMVGLIAAVIIGVVALLGTEVDKAFSDFISRFREAVN